MGLKVVLFKWLIFLIFKLVKEFFTYWSVLFSCCFGRLFARFLFHIFDFGVHCRGCFFASN